jgi:hypothetical protein
VLFLNKLSMLANSPWHDYHKIRVLLMRFSFSACFTVVAYLRSLILLVAFSLISGCGGGGGSGSNPLTSNPTQSSVGSSILSSVSVSNSAIKTSSSSSLSTNVSISGRVTYDYVPHTLNGLNYAATAARPGRGLLVELLDDTDQIVATSLTDTDGKYSFSATRNKLVKVRVKAQLLRTQSPDWNFKVTDNTNNNNLYSMVGNLTAATEANAMRNLHAASGWSDSGYTTARVAAPFAILDSIYVGIERIQAAGNSADFPSLELRWSSKNKAAEGDKTLGEIGTSFFDGDAIYILGDENNDTDEYDRHVILHEWGHYVEAGFARSDSIGGDHAHDDKLDMRVAMSEGFANAFAAMMLDDANYRDSSGQSQADGFFNDVSRKNNSVRGWYSEASVQSIIYNFYTSNSGKVARDFADIFQVIGASNYADSRALISVYVFAEQLRASMAAQASFFNNLLAEQNISVTDEYGSGESNSGGYTGNLPIYKNLPLSNTSVNACSTNRFGAYNKLGTAQYFLINVTTAGTYQFSAVEVGDDSGNSDPDLYLHRRGSLIDLAEGATVDQETLSRFLAIGTYVLELTDARVADIDESAEITACFDVRAQLVN